jgi:hypothetical protein
MTMVTKFKFMTQSTATNKARIMAELKKGRLLNELRRAASLDKAAMERGTKGRHGYCVALMQDNALLSTVFFDNAVDAVRQADHTISTLMTTFADGEPYLPNYGNGECFDFVGVRVYVTVCPAT